MLVHEDAEKLEEKRELKLLNLHKTRQKNYEKKLGSKPIAASVFAIDYLFVYFFFGTDLRKEARQVSKKATQFHQHEFDEPMYNAKKDKYSKKCKTCSFEVEYEEMWNFI